MFNPVKLELFRLVFLYGVNTCFTRTDTDNLFHIRDENLSVTDAACLSGIANRFDHCIRILIGKHDFDLHLWQKVDDIFRATIKFRMAFLTTKALGFRNRYSLESDFLKGFLHFVELERLNDRFDLFHEKISLRFSR